MRGKRSECAIGHPVSLEKQSNRRSIMIKRKADFRKETRTEMRGGTGTVKFERVWERETEMKSKARLFSKLILEPGVSIGWHVHENEEEIFLILEGRAKVSDNGREEILETGDTIITQSGEGHAVACLGDQPLVMLAAIVPY